MRAFKLIALFLFIFVTIMVVVFIGSLGAVNKDSTTKQDFVVVSGETTSGIAHRLKDEGLIKNSFSFYVYIKLIGGKVLPGTYEISTEESATQIGVKLGTGHYKTNKITIIEGWRVSQMAEYFTDEVHLKNASDFMEKAQKYEGYLFPDTYEVKADATSEDIIKVMRDNFDKKTKDLKITPETVILASIVEREAKTEEDRPPIAGVYANRIKIGMRLEADPTVQYAKGSWKSVTIDDLHSVKSPYNTYLNDGLPPGPICSPGLNALKAAANPATHEYFFFFSAKGQTYFSKTLAEHRAKVAQYL